MSNSTRKRQAGKAAKRPPKPYPDFPLYAHPLGYWSKKIKGKIVHIARWGRIRKGKMEWIDKEGGWQAALELYKAQADDLHAGKTPRVKKTGEGLKLKDLCNHFYTAKKRKLAAGEISAATFAGHQQITDLLIEQFGRDRLVDDLAAEDFAALRATMAERWGPVRLSNGITRVKSVFKYGYEAGLVVTAVRYGPEFVKPSAAVLRKHRNKNGERMLEADQLRRLLDALEGKKVETGQKDKKTGEAEKVTLEKHPVLRAMVLLGINCGFIAKDCADLPLTALDLDGGWIDFPRPKTGIDRRCPLWPETMAALQSAIEARPEPRQEAAEGLVFVTTRGRPYLSRGSANPVSVMAGRAMKEVGIHRERIGFATLRHVFRTVADGTRDFPACRYIMGHSDNTMDAVYRERIDDDRLRAVAEHVRQWLFGGAV